MAGEAYSKRYAGGFADGAGGGTPVDSTFLNAVETALLRLLGEDPLADEVGIWTPASNRFVFNKITNANVDAAAAIDKSKLGALNIVNADIAASAAIAKSKLAALNIADADIVAGAAIALSKLASMPMVVTAPTTTLPGSPSDGQLAILVDSLATPTRVWLCQYETSITDAFKWMVLGGAPIVSEAIQNFTTNGYVTIASVAAPNAGVYIVRGGIWAGNGVISPGPQIRIAGAPQRTMAPAAVQFSRGISLHFEDRRTLALNDVVDIQAQANGTDATYAEGSVSLTPIRIS